MISKELFDKTINTLVRAFFEGTLRAGMTCGCAIGNIVADKAQVKLSDTFFDNNQLSQTRNKLGRWFDYVGMGKYVCSADREAGKLFVEEATGLPYDLVLKIERVFERTCKIDALYYEFHTKEEIMEDQYNGLMAVVDVLCKYQGVEDAQPVKELFNYSV